ncbi:ABC transporter permease [Zunongwangia sp. H14]|uniref:ABC transporter permease/M1 family aminopeptidase n=1 Tax=Zunongwangia sp. H14 TaxID=3240792 RepID=UPI0035637FE9
MKLLEILKFEITYQLSRAWIWLSFLVMFIIGYSAARVAFMPVTLQEDFIMNSPFTIATITIFSCQLWLFLAPVVAGEVASRDLHSRMFPLVYTTPLKKWQYLGGRFMAAFILNSFILSGVQFGMLAAFQGPGLDPEIIGPFRPGAYFSAFVFVALTNALIGTAFQFVFALFTGKSMASYFGSLVLFVLSYPMTIILFMTGFDYALYADPIGILSIMNELMSNWTIVEKNVRMFTLEGAMLGNRIFWISFSILLLLFTYFKFKLSYPSGLLWWKNIKARYFNFFRRKSSAETELKTPKAIRLPEIQKSYGFKANLFQIFSIGKSSFWYILKSPGGIFLLIVFPMLLTFMVSVQSEHWGIPMLPKTSYLLAKHLTGMLTSPINYWVIVPLFIIYFAGELVWRDRDKQINEIVDTTPLPDWVLYLGKFTGLVFIIALFMGIIILVGMLAQTILGYYNFEIGLYLQALLGFQLTDYVLFAALILTVQAIVNQKYLGHILALVVYALIVFSSYIGIEYHLLVYGSGAAWSYTDIRGWGSSILPWLFFRIYWLGWALFLILIAKLFWVRGFESPFKKRIRNARLRLDSAAKVTVIISFMIIILAGGFIFYNTNILNEYLTDSEVTESRAQYEKKFGKYENLYQPEKVASKLSVDLYPEKHSASLKGFYTLVNKDKNPVKEIHIEPAFNVETKIEFDRASKLEIRDETLGHSIYGLKEPLMPGDLLELHFEVSFTRQGFTNDGLRSNGAGRGILSNGTYITGGMLPVIGYNSRRELMSADDRRDYNLPRQVTLPDPGEIDPEITSTPPAYYEAIVSTAEGQTAVAPGKLIRQWNENGRAYFEYSGEIPLSGTDLYFSANYDAYKENYKGVALSVYLHPEHTTHRDRLLKSLRASLEYYSEEFGEYPYSFLKVIEQPGNFMGMGVDGSGVITGGEGFFLFNPEGNGFDGMFEITAHEMGHQWWGIQLKPAFAEGAGVISESLAWYSGMQLVKNTKSREALRRFMYIMRQPNPWPPMKTGLPLIRAMDPYANYRKGPFAIYALSEYVGEKKINSALKNLIQKNKGKLATTLDMYNEFEAVTPDSLKPLLHDLFKKDTYWTFETKNLKARKMKDNRWEVEMEIEARKVVSDSAGAETEVPVDQWVEIGVFAPAASGEFLGESRYLQKHFIKSGTQTLTIEVPAKPAKAGVDPYNLLDWREGDNIENVFIPEDEENEK